MQSLFQQVMPELAKVAGLALSFLMVVIANHLQQWLRQRLSEQAIGQLSQIVLTCVRAASQSRVLALKDPSKPGSWDDNTARVVKADVVDRVVEIGSLVISTLRRCGLSEKSIKSMIEEMVESHVLDNKIASPPISRKPDQTIPSDQKEVTE
jgi:hypothetical protein